MEAGKSNQVCVFFRDVLSVCDARRALSRFLFIYGLPAALLASMHSQDKSKAIVTVELQPCCHGDCEKVCVCVLRVIMEAVAKTWWLAAVLVYPQFKRARQLDLAVCTPASLVSHQPLLHGGHWYCSLIHLDWHMCIYIYIYIYMIFIKWQGEVCVSG